MNSHEEKARGRKIAKLVRELWRQRLSLIERGVSHTERQFAASVQGFGMTERKHLAIHAGCRPPSDTTWAEVVAIFCGGDEK
jgi:hypothetical protein